MGDFVTGLRPLPPPKVDAYPPQGQPGELDASDINDIWNALLDVRTGLGFPNRTVVTDSDYSVTPTDSMISFQALTAPRTVTLPSASSGLRQIIIKDESGFASEAIPISVVAQPGEIVDGTTSPTALVVIIRNFGSAALYSNGVQWRTLYSDRAYIVGTGAVPRSIDSMVLDVAAFSVKSFGAKGDGVTDDTAAIQAALNASANTVILPKGTYNIAGTITFPGARLLQGAGAGITIINYTGAGTAVGVTNPGVRIYQVGMSDLTLQTSTGAVGIDLDSVSSGAFHDLIVKGFSTYGVRIHSTVTGGCVFNRFDNVTAINLGTGFRLEGLSSNANVWHGCRASSCASRGWDIQDSNDNTIEDSQAELCDVGYFFDSITLGLSDWNRVVNCRAETNTTSGVTINSANMRNTVVGNMWFATNGTNLVDNGTTTRRLGDVLSVSSVGNVVGGSGTSIISGASVFLGTSSSRFSGATSSPSALGGQVANSGGLTANWIGNSTTLTQGRIAGFCADTPPTHASPVAYITFDGSYEFAVGPKIISGSGTPEAAVTAPVGSIYLRTNGGAGTSAYVKQSGAGNTGWRALAGDSVSADRGDTAQTLTVGTDDRIQRWATTLTANRIITLSTTGAANGDSFRVVRTGLGAFTLDVGGLKTIPSATAAFADVMYSGSAWILTGYGAL